MSWEFWVDRGGTFTDCIGRAPDGRLHTAKLLSEDDAATTGIRSILEGQGVIAPGAAIPPCRVKLGTTLATNALLERRGAPTLLVTHRGLGGLFQIGTQERPDLFDLEIRKTPPLHTRTAEVTGRVAADGTLVEELDEGAARSALRAARDAGITSVAIVTLHAYAYPALEERLSEMARELGFELVVASHQVAREMGLLSRGETATVDAYLTPLLRSHVARVEASLPGVALRFMQSSGSLADAEHFRGPGALLSGPAGGVVGAARVAESRGFRRAIGFDMGGTSTDVSLIVDGEVERSFETRVAGIRVKAPMLRIHTVAAGGGSLCRFDGFRLTVGPESAGADPGPLCYGRRDASGELRAREIALTDANLLLGRLPGDLFPFALDRAPVEREFGALCARLRSAGHTFTLDELAAGFVEVANESMAQAIQQVSVARGVDPRDSVLVGFGGAGGQHVCAVARLLGIRTILLHPLAGLLSAYGIGMAEAGCDRQRDAGRVPLLPESALAESVAKILRDLGEEACDVLAAEGIERDRVRIDRFLDLRHVGTDAALTLAEPESGRWVEAFQEEHQARFGYTRPDHPVEIVTARVRARAPGNDKLGGETATPIHRAPGPDSARREAIWFPERGRCETAVLRRDQLDPNSELRGPAVILSETSTVVLEPGFRARAGVDGTLTLVDEAPSQPAPSADLSRPDPIRLEVFGNRFMSIAEQMGAVLCNTALSTNIKERLDYSCAVFDGEGGLVANAPHIPVHLGAMGATVRAIREALPELAPGDVAVTNDPACGGSHLPDVTVVTPVFLEPAPDPAFFVASRGHHADLGGKTPGSMPADSTTLEEEGVLIAPFLAVRGGGAGGVGGGRFDEARVRRILSEARYPARNPDDNVADLVAMVAANRAGERLLRELIAERGREAVDVTMAQLQAAAAGKVAREIEKLPDGEHRFLDALDDGTPVAVCLGVDGPRMKIDFTGTGPTVPGNLNAPRAVVEAAVIYVLRSLVAERIPLNGGCLEPVEIVIPPGCVLDPPRNAAVVGGNVETSQRVVDVLLGALGRVAASQGTMNNVTFGTPSFGYYETLGGGAGAGEGFAGASGVHTHMTNTRITDAEVLESRFPVRLSHFGLRVGSGGAGRWTGGDGIVRGYTFLEPVTLSLLTERRDRAPYGLGGGASGARGRNRLFRADGSVEELPGKCTLNLEAGDRLVVETPGGGGFGVAADPR